MGLRRWAPRTRGIPRRKELQRQRPRHDPSEMTRPRATAAPTGQPSLPTGCCVGALLPTDPSIARSARTKNRARVHARSAQSRVLVRSSSAPPDRKDADVSWRPQSVGRQCRGAKTEVANRLRVSHRRYDDRARRSTSRIDSDHRRLGVACAPGGMLMRGATVRLPEDDISAEKMPVSDDGSWCGRVLRSGCLAAALARWMFSHGLDVHDGNNRSSPRTLPIVRRQVSWACAPRGTIVVG